MCSTLQIKTYHQDKGQTFKDKDQTTEDKEKGLKLIISSP